MATRRSGIFISYRHGDAATAAGWLGEAIAQTFGHRRVFRDVVALQPGERFPAAIHDTLASCGVLLAVIGPRWLSASDQAGHRRLDDPDDWVRQEIGLALARGIPVIPILVEGAPLPERDKLPPDLQSLHEMQAIELRDDRHRDEYVRDIVRQIKSRAGILPTGALERCARRVRAGLPLAGVVGAVALLAGWHLGRQYTPCTQDYVAYTVSGQLETLDPQRDPFSVEFYVKPPDFHVRSDGWFSGTVPLSQRPNDAAPTLIISPRSPHFDQATVHLGESDVGMYRTKRDGLRMQIEGNIRLAQRRSDDVPASTPQVPIATDRLPGRP